MLIIGHRGAKAHEPENTLRSIAKAMSQGAGAIEIDIYAVADQLIVIHDDTLERTTNGKGKLIDHNLDYLRSLNAGKGEKIPVLQEVLALTNNKALLNIELKGPNTALPLAKLLQQMDMSTNQRLLLSSFNYHELSQAVQLLPDIPTAVLVESEEGIEEAFKCAERINASFLNVEQSLCSTSLQAKAITKNLKLLVYTVNTPEAMENMFSIQVAGIFTDYPDRAVHLQSIMPTSWQL